MLHSESMISSRHLSLLGQFVPFLYLCCIVKNVPHQYFQQLSDVLDSMVLSAHFV